MTKPIIKTAFTVGIVATVAGCACQNGLMESRMNQLMRKAESAQSTANEALQTANQAKSIAQSNAQRMQRMFQSSQQK